MYDKKAIIRPSNQGDVEVASGLAIMFSYVSVEKNHTVVDVSMDL